MQIGVRSHRLMNFRRQASHRCTTASGFEVATPTTVMAAMDRHQIAC